MPTMEDTQLYIPSNDVVNIAKDVGFASQSVQSISNPRKALDDALLLAKEQQAVVVVTGSFYLIDGIRTLLLNVSKAVVN